MKKPWHIRYYLERGSGIPMHPPLEPGGFLEEGLSYNKSSQVKNYSPGCIEQAPSRGHEASPQSGLGAGCMLFSNSKKLRGLGAHAQARRMINSLSLSVAGVSSFLSPPRSA